MARYYEVPTDTIKKLVERNREELEGNGYRVLEGEELSDMKSLCRIESRVRSMAIFSRRAVLEGERLASFKDVCQIESRARTLAIFSRREGVHDSVYPRR